MLGDSLHEAAEIGVEVARVATLREQGESAPGHAAADVTGLQLRAQHRADRVEQILERERSRVGVQRRQLVGLEIHDRPQTTLERLCELRPAGLEERAALKESAAGVELERLLELLRDRP